MRVNLLKYKCWVILLAFILLAACLVPIPRRVNVNLEGVICDQDDPESLQNCKLVINGWAKWYLIREDCFKGEFYIQEKDGERLGGLKVEAALIKQGDSVFFKPGFIAEGYSSEALNVYKKIWCLSKDMNEAVVYDEFPIGNNQNQCVFAAPATSYEENQALVQKAVISTGLELDDWWGEVWR